MKAGNVLNSAYNLTCMWHHGTMHANQFYTYQFSMNLYETRSQNVLQLTKGMSSNRYD